jgi:PAS domain S-box-containing protein
MPLPEGYTPERTGAEEFLSATARQLEALTALAAAPGDVRELEEIFAGLADTITRLTDYRSCLVVLFSDEPPYHPRVLSYSSNVPARYIALLAAGSYPRNRVASLIARGVRIEVGGLGFAAYYPPSHYAILDEVFPERYKTEAQRCPSGLGASAWQEGNELFVPLATHDGELVGLISLDDPRSGRAPDPRSVLPALAFARQTAQLVARRRDAERLTEQAEREALVNRITHAVRRSLDTAEVFRAATSELGLHLGVDRCVLFVLDREAGVVRNAAEYSAPGVCAVGREYDMPLVAGLIERVREHGVLAFSDAASDPFLRPVYEGALKDLGTRSVMYAAIRVGEEVQAAFALSTVRERRHWRSSDLALARAVADQTGIAIRQAELYQRAEATSVREALVNRLSHAIRASLNLPDVLRAATHELGRALRASRVYIRPFEADRPGYAPVMYEYLAPGCESNGSHTISYTRPVGKYLMRTQKTLVINDALNFAGESRELGEQVRVLAMASGARSKIYCPLIVQGEFRGALCIHQSDRVRRWAADEVLLVESVAAQLATGIAQAELFEMVERAKRTWEATFDAMSDGIFIFSNEQRLVRVNRAGASLEARAPHEILGLRCCDILRAPSGEGCIVERATAEGRAVTVEYRPEALGRAVLVTAEPIVEDGEQVGAVCTVRDLTELRRLEAIARERQTLLTHILESAREAIYASDTEGRLQWCNPVLARAAGRRMTELIGCSFFELAHEADRQRVREHFFRALAGEPQNYEMRYVTGGGHVRYVTVDNAPLVVDGRTTGVLGIARDVTEQKQERERAVQADKLRALGQLASGVAHDFNNSLAAILGRAQLLRRSTSDPETARSLDIIQTAAEDAAATVRRIRSFAQQAPGEQFAPLDLEVLLRDAVEITRTRWENDARARGLSYDVRLACECVAHARGSASELREVFVNLIVNAIEAMPEGGRLDILCRRRGEQLEVSFSDSGVGMSEEVRARIFEPFYTTKGAQGTGLGLFVSYGIVERHGGHISVESERGLGTTFKVCLPHGDPEPSRCGSGQGSDAEGRRQLSVLVVDDEETVRETLAEIIEALGHRVVRVEGGRAALAAVDENEFDLIFTDLSMPEMDGWEVSRAIRARRPEARVVVVTGYGREAALAPQAAESHVAAVIGKPFDFRQVEELLKTYGEDEDGKTNHER